MTDEWQPGEKYQMYLSKIREILGEERQERIAGAIDADYSQL